MTDQYTVPDWDRIALITIDVQRDTLDGRPLEIPGTSEMLPRLLALLATFRRFRLPIVHMVRLYTRDGANADLVRRSQIEQGNRILAPGSTGAELAPGITERDDISLDASILLDGGVQSVSSRESIIYKPRWGAFYGTRLHDHLQSLKITTLAFAGCNFPNCPRTSIYEASERDYRIIALADAISGVYPRGIEELQGIGVNVMACSDTQAILAERLGLGQGEEKEPAHGAS